MRFEVFTMTRLSMDDSPDEEKKMQLQEWASKNVQEWTETLLTARAIHTIRKRSMMFMILGCCALFLSGYYVSLWGNLTQRGVLKNTITIKRVQSPEEIVEERLFLTRMEKRMRERKKNLTIACRDLGKTYNYVRRVLLKIVGQRVRVRPRSRCFQPRLLNRSVFFYLV